MGVPTPPRLAAYAIPRISTIPKRVCLVALMMAIAMGSIISTVAVLLIHILKTAVVSMKPKISFMPLPVPVRRSI